MDILRLSAKVRWISLLWFPLWIIAGEESVWDNWWSYEGINGPFFWGRTKRDWKMCQYGRQQSPINIEPSRLLYDPQLKSIRMDSAKVGGLLLNTGHDITLQITGDGVNSVNISEGPLSYTYTISEIKFHLSNNHSMGSEHRVSGKSFPAEMHVIAYNSELYTNISEASKGVRGLAIIAVFIQAGRDMHVGFHLISKHLRWQRFKGNAVKVSHVSLHNILPVATEYITYEGSLTQPGCHESVTWIILNTPLVLGKEQLTDLRVLFNGRENSPYVSLETNSRPLMPLNNRVVRTNINSQKKTSLCTMQKETIYKVNPRYSWK